MTDEPPYAPTFPILNLSPAELAKAPPEINCYTALSEARRYIGHVTKLCGFSGSLSEEIEITNWRVPEGAFSFQEIAMRQLPVHQPHDMRDTIRILSEKSGSDTKQMLKNLRIAFRAPAEEMLAKFGDDPGNPAEREVVEFMLRGAMFQYSDKKTLSQNAAAFLFERERAKIIKAKQENGEHRRPVDKPKY